MIVAVTGISSRVGLSLVPKLQKDPSVERIIGIDISDYPGKADKLHFVKADIRDRDAVESAIGQADVLIHLAFIVTLEKLPDIKTIYDINVNGSKTVFEAASRCHVKKIIHLSSISAFGHRPESPPLVSENSPRLGTKTSNFYYSHTKGLVEDFLDQFEKNYPDIAVIRVRPPIITGPQFFKDSTKVFRKKKKNIKMIYPLNHKGNLPLQLIHVDDLSEVLSMMVQKDVRGAFNVASNFIPDARQFIKDTYDRDVKPSSWMMNSVVNLLIGLQKIWPKMGWLLALKYPSYANTEKVEKEFNWKPRYSTEECFKMNFNL